MPELSLPACFIGVDVAKASLAAALPDGKSDSFQNTEPGARKLVAWARRTSPNGELRFVCESSGPYSLFMARHLLACPDVSVAIVDPARVRYSAKARGCFTKTDLVDARMILDYAMQNKPAPYTEPMPEQAQLSVLCHELAQLQEAASRIKCRIASQAYLLDSPPEVHASQARQLEFILLEIKLLEQEVEALFKTHPQMDAQRELFRTIPGIGPVFSRELVSLVAVLAERSPKQLAQYAGLAPAHRQSGSSVRGKSMITHRGNPRLRQLAYMAALSASQYNPQLREDYQRLLVAGKPVKLALIAIARKLLLLAQKILITNTPYDPEYTRA